MSTQTNIAILRATLPVGSIIYCIRWQEARGSRPLVASFFGIVNNAPVLLNDLLLACGQRSAMCFERVPPEKGNGLRLFTTHPFPFQCVTEILGEILHENAAAFHCYEIR